MLKKAGDWVELGGADEQKPAKEGTVEPWGRSPENPVGGWYGLMKGFRGRFGVYTSSMRAFLLLTPLLFSSCASDPLASAELQSKCAISAAKAFEVAYGKRNLTDYTNHYNSKLGKCLMRVRSTSAEFDLLSTVDEVVDVYEHRTLAHDFSQINIKTQQTNKICYTELPDRKDCVSDEYGKIATAIMSE